jgi:hypothetical protein
MNKKPAYEDVKLKTIELSKALFALTTSENATERELSNIMRTAVYLSSTNVASEAHDAAPKSPHMTRYDLLR